MGKTKLQSLLFSRESGPDKSKVVWFKRKHKARFCDFSGKLQLFLAARSRCSVFHMCEKKHQRHKRSFLLLLIDLFQRSTLCSSPFPISLL
ncbi:hypothetical protein SLA2020_058190 [Shorea laevis]